MDQRSKGVAKLRRVEAILENPEIYRLAELIPHPDPQSGGRQRHYPVKGAFIRLPRLSCSFAQRQYVVAAIT